MSYYSASHEWVLDKGYIVLKGVMGDDLSVVNAARVSFAKASTLETINDTTGEKKMRDADVRLINYLANNGHSSPFRHCTLSYEVKAPLMVARQWWKYVVGSDHTMDGWNEISRRYVTGDPEFYIPEVWRSAPDNKKQGSGEEVSKEHSERLTARLIEDTIIATAVYQAALDEGICPEQARLFLPAYAMYTTWRWTASLQSVTHFLKQRLDEHAQWEIQQYAKALEKITRPLFPISFAALLGESNDNSNSST